MRMSEVYLTFYCERHKGEVYIAQQRFTSCAKQIYIIGREVEVKLDSEVKQNNVLAFISRAPDAGTYIHYHPCALPLYY